jgi:ATP-dependent DNA helicase DinG
MRSRFEEEVREAFAAGGPLARALTGFEFRPGQLRLAMAWADALARGEILMAEAGTGSGKTLAYLIPSILSGQKTVVSTGTKTLQQQIVENDVPLVREVLRASFSCVVLKGRGNYLCRRRWKRFAAEPLFEFPGEAGYYETMCRFAETTRTGDISECPGIPDDFHAWSEVNARSETCDTSSCQEIDRCFLTDARRLAQSADLVVVNHHLYFADLAIRRKKEGGPDAAGRGGWERGGEVLPLADAAIFDEAHGIEETASSFFGVSVSFGRALELVRDLRRAADRDEQAWRLVPPAAEEFRRAADMMFRAAGSGEGRFFLPRPGTDRTFDRLSADLLRTGEDLSRAISAAPLSLSPGADTTGDAEILLRRVDSFAGDFESLHGADPATAVSWGERRGNQVTLHSTPVEIQPFLADGLWRGGFPVLLTSATLSVSGTLSYIRERIGLAEVDAKELIVDNEFDFAGKALVYVPAGLPDPGEDAFPASAARETAEIMGLSGGGGLILCTSYRTLGALVEVLRDAFPHPLLVQGEAPRTHLLRTFREDADAVLVGTGTFWEGIDVPGESLRCVVIDKLPFSPPTDPVVTARIRAIRDRGGDPFLEYQVPEAVLALRQGVGRLLRRSDDFGVIALLDHRVITRGYGTTFRESLPSMPWTRDRSAVSEFFRISGRGSSRRRKRLPRRCCLSWTSRSSSTAWRRHALPACAT